VGAFVVVVGVVAVVIAHVARGPGWPLWPAVVLLLGLATILSVAHEYYDLLVLAWPFAAVLHRPCALVLDRTATSDRAGTIDRDARLDGGGAPAVVLALTALPALIVSVVPANDTVKLLGLGSGTGIISSLTTASLLVAMVGAMVVIAFMSHREVAMESGSDSPAVA
jgi:hypothetical protein